MSQEKANGLILYDGSCPMCQSGVEKFGDFLVSQNYQLMPIQDPWVVENIPATEAELMNEMKIWTPDQKLIGGLDSYRYMAKRIWWGIPFWLITGIPGIYYLADLTYQWIANNRFNISKTCNIHPPESKEGKS